MSIKDRIVAYAVSQGADLVGVARPRAYRDYLDQVRGRLQETQATGKDFMLSTDAITFFKTLIDARHTLAEARAIIILGAYAFDQKADYKATRLKLQGKIARTYAYYPVVRQIAEQVAEYIEKNGHKAVHGQQIPLKYVAHDIGLGSYGWNGLLLTKEFGSYVALRAVITDMDLEPDAFALPITPCENCKRCLRACPTGALYAPYKVNPALCINPLTRKEGDIPQGLRRSMGNWVCGCDICQEVCPVNHNLKRRAPDPRAGFDPAHHSSHRTLAGLTRNPDLKSLVEQSDEFVMRRNAIIALGNIGGEEALRLLRSYGKGVPGGPLAAHIESATAQITERIDRHTDYQAQVG
jgi:epoxyqueuosine reductase